MRSRERNTGEGGANGGSTFYLLCELNFAAAKDDAWSVKNGRCLVPAIEENLLINI